MLTRRNLAYAPRQAVLSLSLLFAHVLSAAQGAAAPPAPAPASPPASPTSAAGTATQNATSRSDGDAEPFFKRAREGWFWYDDPIAPVSVPAKAVPPPVVQKETAPPPMTAQEIDLANFKGFQLKVERALQAATQNPTEANVAHFLEMWAESKRKAAVLADTAQAVAARMPWIDDTFTGSRPTTPAAMQVYDSIRMQDDNQLMQEMAQTYGLYFFFRSNCAYCHLQAPMLKQFEAKYGFTIMPVSLDGSTLPQFPGAARDNGMAAKLAETLGIPMQHFVTPAVILAQPSSGLVVPVGFGVMNVDQMVERIASVVKVRDKSAGQAPRNQIAALVGAAPSAREGQAAMDAVQRARRAVPSSLSSLP